MSQGEKVPVKLLIDPQEKESLDNFSREVRNFLKKREKIAKDDKDYSLLKLIREINK